MAGDWHRTIFDGVSLPSPAYAGNFRGDSRFQDLVTYEVRVGRREGTPAVAVSEQLRHWEAAMQTSVARLDSQIPIGDLPSGADELAAVVDLCAYSHGEWVRIHPFANGNGRVARLWTRWITLRYALPPFVRLHPRPEATLYAAAGAMSMEGDHDPTVRLFHRWAQAVWRLPGHAAAGTAGRP
jgi:Fic/DOC family